MKRNRRNNIKGEFGASMVEAAMVVAFVALIGAAPAQSVGNGLDKTFIRAADGVAGCSQGQAGQLVCSGNNGLSVRSQ